MTTFARWPVGPSRLASAWRVLAGWLRTRRPAMECAALLLALVASAAMLALLTWHATGALRDRVAETARPDREAEAILTTDLTTSWVAERRTAAEPYTTRREQPEGPGTGGGDAGSATAGTGGAFVSAGAVGAALLPCLVAALVVLRRYRRVAVTVEDTAPHADHDLREAPEPATTPPAEAHGDTADDADDTDDTDDTDHTDHTDGTDGTDDVIAPRSERASDAASDVGAGPQAGGSTPARGARPATAGPEGGERYGAGTPQYVARERLYERRAAPRIAYEGDGRLRSRSGESPMSLADLSESGLRCRSSSASLPKATDHVSVTFPLDGEEITLNGQVSWRRTTAEGTELGVQFQRLSQDDSRRLRAVCLQQA